MINGVLVEKTVKDVTPALQTNSEGLRKVLDELVKQYKRQQDDMEKWKVRLICLEQCDRYYNRHIVLASRLGYESIGGTACGGNLTNVIIC